MDTSKNVRLRIGRRTEFAYGDGERVMLSNEEAIEILAATVKNGTTLAVAGHADLLSIKRLLDQCLQDNIPAVLGPCAVGG